MECIPIVVKSLGKFLKKRSIGWWCKVLGIVLYWHMIKFLHRTMEAGPIVLILTALIAIFTYGLSDDTGATADGRMSAYAVFNQGFQSMMGDVDVENLIAQHAGGGGGALAFRQQQQQQQGEDRWEEEEEEEEDEMEPNNNANNPPPPENRARRSNKKERRKRNHELKKEMQRQRDAAAAMGFGAGGGGDDVDDMMAMNRLVEEQVNDGGGVDELDVDEDNI